MSSAIDVPRTTLGSAEARDDDGGNVVDEMVVAARASAACATVHASTRSMVLALRVELGRERCCVRWESWDRDES